MPTKASHRFNNDLRYRDSDHLHQTALTPAYVLDPIRVDLGGTVGLDPCTTSENPTHADMYYCPPQDGLALPWDSDAIFVNPPYGKAREPWGLRSELAGREGKRVALLIPAHTDTKLFQRLASTCDALVFLRGRVKFGEFGDIRDNGRQSAASHGSMLLAWNTKLDACSLLGVRLTPNF